ncbi:MAG: class I SAM-dependent methyltransferase [Planctomycetota bacterium]|jgi:SAM-dependent methyltransferase
MLPALSTTPGVLDEQYAGARKTGVPLVVRLRTRAEVVVRCVRKHGVARPLRLLEVGAAEGRTLLEMASRLGDGEFVGVEYSRDLLAAQPLLPPNIRMIQGDAMSLPQRLSGGSFDVVAMLAILEHLPDPHAALAEALRVLKPGGLVIATCPNPFWDNLAERLSLVDGGQHLENIDLDRLQELLTAAGFKVIEARPFMWAPVAILPYARIRVPPRLGLGIDSLVGRVPLLRRLCVNACAVGRRPNRAPRS